MLDLRLPTMLQSYETLGDSLAFEYVSIVSLAVCRPNI